MSPEKILLTEAPASQLAQSLARLAQLKLETFSFERFPNSEYKLQISNDLNGAEVFLLFNNCENPNNFFWRILLAADAAARQAPKRLTLISPWLPYSAQDKVFRVGEPLSTEVVAKLLEASPIDEFAFLDLHSPENNLKEYKKPVHNLDPVPLFCEHIKSSGKDLSHAVVAALDKGSVPRAEKAAKLLDLPLIKFDKQRDRETGEVSFSQLNGDLKGKNLLAFDDFLSTGGTLTKATTMAKSMGASTCEYYITHVVAPIAVEAVAKSSIDAVFTTNSFEYLLPEFKAQSKFNVIDSAAVFIKIFPI